MNDKQYQEYLKVMAEVRKGYRGIFRTTDDNGQTWSYTAVRTDGTIEDISEEKYRQLKGRFTDETKSHTPKYFPGVYGYSVTF